MLDTTSYKILFLDIENAPNVSYTWGAYDQNVVAFEREWYLLSFAFKWQGDKKVSAYSLADFDLFKTEPQNDRELVKKLWEVMDEADLIVAHNGDRHDIRKANARFLAHGLTPPSPYSQYDTLKVARKVFALNSNKLDNLAKFLHLGEKKDTGGFDLWLGCMAGVESSFKKMVTYNKHDVTLLELVYEKLRGWGASHPNVTITSNQSYLCPVCGSKTERRGWRNLKSYRAQSYHCLNKTCGKYSQGPREKIPQTLLA